MTRLGDDVVGALDHGLKSGVGTTAVPLVASTRLATRGVYVKAAASNTGTVFVGNSDVTTGGTEATDGYPLFAGESVMLPIEDAQRIYVRADGANQKVNWLSV